MQIIHIEASRHWITGIITVPPTSMGHKPGLPVVIVATQRAICKVGCLEQHSFMAPCHGAFSVCQHGVFTWEKMSLDYFHTM